MAKSRNARSSSTSVPNVNLVNIPGLNVKELLELEDIFPDLRRHLCFIMFPVLIIAQIRLALSSVKPEQIQGLPSVNTYNRLFLAKSDSLVYVTSAMSIRRSMVTYADSQDIDPIISDHDDLCNNRSGPITTRGSIASAIGDPARLRAFRRGFMHQAIGSIQAAPVHNSRRLCRDVEVITANDYLSRLPFNTRDIDISSIIDSINFTLSPSGIPVKFIESPALPNGTVPLEDGIYIARELPNIPDVSKAPADLSNLPAWKRASIQQARNLKGGN